MAADTESVDSQACNEKRPEIASQQASCKGQESDALTKNPLSKEQSAHVRHSSADRICSGSIAENTEDKEPIQELRWQLQQQAKYISELEQELWQLDAQESAQRQLQIMANTHSTSLSSRRPRDKDYSGALPKGSSYYVDSERQESHPQAQVPTVITTRRRWDNQA